MPDYNAFANNLRDRLAGGGFTGGFPGGTTGGNMSPTIPPNPGFLNNQSWSPSPGQPEIRNQGGLLSSIVGPQTPMTRFGTAPAIAPLAKPVAAPVNDITTGGTKTPPVVGARTPSGIRKSTTPGRFGKPRGFMF